MATGPSTDEGASPLDPTSDAAFVAWLRGLFGADGTLHVPRLVIVDDWGRECIVLQRQDLPGRSGGEPSGPSRSEPHRRQPLRPQRHTR